jgi:hypothetical protein
LSNLVGVGLFFDRMLQKLLSHALGIQAVSHKVMSPVAKYADEFRG